MTASKKSSVGAEPQADIPDISVLVNEVIEAAGIPALIHKAIEDAGIPVLVANAIEEADILGQVKEHVQKVDLAAGIEKYLMDRDAIAEAKAIEIEIAAKEKDEERIAEVTRADRAAEKRRQKQEDDKQKLVIKARDRAKMSYDSLVKQVGASSLKMFEDGTSMALRLGNGSSFHPTLELELTFDDLELESGRYLNKRTIELAADLPGFIASEAFILVEGNGSTALYGSPIETPLRIGDGSRASLVPGALAFRRISATLSVADAS